MSQLLTEDETVPQEPLTDSQIAMYAKAIVSSLELASVQIETLLDQLNETGRRIDRTMYGSVVAWSKLLNASIKIMRQDFDNVGSCDD